MKVRRFKKAAEGDEEQQLKSEEGASQKEIETLLLKTIEENVAFLSQTLILGLALIFIKADLKSKEDLQKIKFQTVTNKLYPILKMIVGDRQHLTQELRLLWRYGAQRYAAKKNRDLKSAIGT